MRVRIVKGNILYFIHSSYGHVDFNMHPFKYKGYTNSEEVSNRLNIDDF